VWDGDTEVIGRGYGCTIMLGALALGGLCWFWLIAVGVILASGCLGTLMLGHPSQKKPNTYILSYRNTLHNRLFPVGHHPPELNTKLKILRRPIERE
jgi:hypothetical protein